MHSRLLRRALAVACLLAPLSAVAHSSNAYSSDSNLNYRNSDWMSALDGAKRVRQLSLPGTHDSLSFHGGDIVRTQSLSLRTQLEAGIRAFDVRTRHIDNVFAIHHGPVYQHAMFGDVLDSMVAFLAQHPGETLLVRVKPEHTEQNVSRSFEATFAEYNARYSGYIWQPTGQDPLLDEVRGKIVILQNFAGATYGLDYSGSFDTQDAYNLTSNWDLHGKWEKVKAQVWRANGRGHSSINFLSGSGGSFPYFVASGHSSPQTGAPRLLTGRTTPGWKSSYPDFPRVGCFIGICSIAFEGTNDLTRNLLDAQRGKLGHVGIVFADFPGAGLIDSIIRVNFGR